MKIEKFELNGKTYDVLCADVFSTNDELRATVIFELHGDEDLKSISGNYDDFFIHGHFFNLQPFMLDDSDFGGMYFDVDYINGDIARATIITGVWNEINTNDI